MVVQHNIPAMNANRYYNINNAGLSKSLEKLSSGYQINRAGDNAAGLAVSEKMRSQIGGLTQGVKNAQDGISMIQTFEGALTETDSILQRMKVLADQAANGTYQNDVDREAIQLEFNQLNDELNQIADTDFNGVVMLNGGQMADGLKAVDGKFDYANNPRVAKQLANADINRFDSQFIDDSIDGTGKNTGDGKLVTRANALWEDFGFDRANGSITTDDGPDEIEVTFKYNATNKTWKAESATGGAKIDNLVCSTSNNGGFMVGGKSANKLTGTATPSTISNVANVILKEDDIIDGDTIVIKFKNPSVKNTGIENIGVHDPDLSAFHVSNDADATKEEDMNLKAEINISKVETTNNSGGAAMSQDIKDLFDMLDGAKVEVNYASGQANPCVYGSNGTAALKSDGAIKLTMKSKSGADVVLSFSGDGSVSSPANGTFTVGKTTFKATYDANGLQICDEGGTSAYVTLKPAAASKGTSTADGKIVYTLSNDMAKYSTKAKASAEVVDPANVVSKPNGYNQASSPLTYADDLGLQAGARTKDLVKFTFSYKSNGIGDLKANLNCSSREDGLGTSKLSLLTQKDANLAIDKIDQAINKVSMIRATFGATQNRLEHKIDNMNVTKENITSAESRIRDTDINEEMANFTKNQILSQASQSMLAQANSLPQNVIQLLG